MPSDNDNVPSLVLTRSARVGPHRQSPSSALAPMLHPSPTRLEHCQVADAHDILVTSAAVGTSQDGTPRAVGSTPKLTKPRTPSMSLMATGSDTRCCCDTKKQLQPSLATLPSRTLSTALPTRPASSWHVDKHRRGNRGHGGNTLPAYSLLHITCNCDDTVIDTMYHVLHHNGQQSHFTLRHYSVRHRC